MQIRELVDGYNSDLAKENPDAIRLFHSLDAIEAEILSWHSTRERVDSISGLSSADLRKSARLDQLEEGLRAERRSLLTNPFVTEHAEVLAGPEATLPAGAAWSFFRDRDQQWVDASSVTSDRSLDVTISGEEAGEWLLNFKIGQTTYKGRARKDQVTLRTQFRDVSNVPLYPNGVPTPEDVLQSNLGDCYLQAALASLAAQNPAHIAGKMIYDAGDKVVVRLYKLPEYSARNITVDKSIPETTGGVELYNRGALWVRMVQKAYAASGLGTGLLRPTNISYQDIAGHLPAYAMGVLLGREIETSAASGEEEQEAEVQQARLPWGDEVQTYAIYREDDRTPSWFNPSAQDQQYSAGRDLLRGIFQRNQADMDNWARFADAHMNELGNLDSIEKFREFFDANDLEGRLADPILDWVTGSGFFRGAVGSGHYSRGQQRLVEKISGALFEHRTVVTGTKNQAPAGGGGVGGSGEPKYRGLAFKHAYSVLAVRRNASEDPEANAQGPHTFLKIRNPWGEYKRVYDVEEDESWTARAVDNAGGTFWIELNDFSTNFGDVAIG